MPQSFEWSMFSPRSNWSHETGHVYDHVRINGYFVHKRDCVEVNGNWEKKSDCIEVDGHWVKKPAKKKAK